MLILSLVLSIIALVLSVVAIVLLRGGPFFAPVPAPLPNYTISGTVKVTNDCDGLHASIPNQVTIETELSNQNGSVGIPGRATVNLAPDPADPNNPIKIGTYTITVRWLPGATIAPAFWRAPKVLERPWGLQVCSKIVCPSQGPCHDVVTAADVPFVNPATAHNIEVVCACK